MPKYKYDNDIASLKFDLQQVVYQLDRSVFSREGFDQDWHFSDAIELLDQVMFKVAAWQQDTIYGQEPVQIDDEIPF